MREEYISKISEELGLKPKQILATASLLSDGATIPFIARYRKEMTGSIDEVAITSIRDRMAQLEELDKRRESILKSLKERELLTDELDESIKAAETISTLEDIYLPFRPKRRTRATIAKEKGLEPLAKIIFQQNDELDPNHEALSYIDEEKGVQSSEDALAGVRDIIAEWINEDKNVREKMRSLFAERGIFRAKVIAGSEEEGAKYRDYFEWTEPAASAPSHRVLAVRRGEKEGYLSLQVRPPDEDAIKIPEDLFIKGEGQSSEQVKEAVHDSYKRLLSYSMETEVRLETKKKAETKAISIFSDNLRELLLASPLGQKRVLAVDPGIRTGCKVTCLDRQGKLLHFETIFPFKSQGERSKSASSMKGLCNKFQIEAIAIGNGTAGRETELFINDLEISRDISIIMVNESGASVYSASSVAREEFPELDVSYRGAVSIGRRLMDPLAELVKIDPKAIGVGQYQHDVNQQALKESLDDAVISCVNAVGVEVNTASEQLLTYVSGLGPQLAKNIIKYRNENGSFPLRKNLKNVPRLGPKAFEQAAGFLRIQKGENPLDKSAVHPESYGIVEAMAADLNCSIKNLLEDEKLRLQIELNRYVTEKVGMPTLKDILDELSKPGRDPRKKFENLKFAEGIDKIEDLEQGTKLPGVITNVTAFGAFVDIGVHQDGLVHVSQLADHYVKDPFTEVKVQQHVMVTVLDVDLKRKRISLSMKKRPGQAEGSDKKNKQRPRTGKKKNDNRQAKSNRGPVPFNNPFEKAFKK